jgi:ubiquinone/menaquinone biosynthesis C-methylase UbiE
MRFLDPLFVLRQFGVYGTEKVGDIGAGSGHFMLAAAPRLDGGQLFVVDVDASTVARLASLAKEAGHRHVHALCGDACRPGGVPLGDAVLDKAILANVLFQASDRDGLIRETSRLVRPGGKVLVLEVAGNHELGPRQTHRVSSADARALLERHGFVYEKDVDAGDYHYGMICTRV